MIYGGGEGGVIAYSRGKGVIDENYQSLHVRARPVMHICKSWTLDKINIFLT